MLPTLLATTLLAPLTSAWAIAFYTGHECTEDTTFNNAMYSSNDPKMSSCMAAGAPGPGCSWHTNNGQNVADCTAPMSPQPLSFRMPEGTSCFMGVDTTDCLETRVVGGDEVNHCWDIEDWYQHGDTVWFRCWDD